MVDDLDEEYGCEYEDAADPSNEAEALFSDFVEQVIIDYPVRHLQGTGKVFKINAKDYVGKN